MNLYLITQTVNDHNRAYRAAVVAAENEDQARGTLPETFPLVADTGSWVADYWAAPEHVTVKLLGTAPAWSQPHVVIAV